MRPGWVSISRSITESRDLRTPAERWAMVWMVLNAAVKPTTVPTCKADMTLARGQFSHSTRHLAAEWGMSEAAVRRFLSKLESRRTIRRERDAEADAGQLVVTLCNYDQYQSSGRKGDAPPVAHGDAPTDANIIKETSSSNEEPNPPTPPAGGEPDRGVAKVRRGRGKPGYTPRPDSKAQRDRWDRFFAVFPNREEEAKGYSKYRCFCDQDQEDLIWAAGEYVERCRSTGKTFFFKAKNWLNRDPSEAAAHGGWSDFITPSDTKDAAHGAEERQREPSAERGNTSSEPERVGADEGQPRSDVHLGGTGVRSLSWPGLPTASAGCAEGGGRDGDAGLAGVLGGFGRTDARRAGVVSGGDGYRGPEARWSADNTDGPLPLAQPDDRQHERRQAARAGGAAWPADGPGESAGGIRVPAQRAWPAPRYRH